MNNILDTSQWTLQLPVAEKPGSSKPLIISEITTFSLPPYFCLKNGVLKMTSSSNGVTTKNSKYSRTEFRQKQNVPWSMTKGTHTLSAELSITEVPKVNPIMCFAQVKSEDIHVQVVELQLRNGDLVACYKNPYFTKTILQKNYVLNTKFTIKMIAQAGILQIFINGLLKCSIINNNRHCYFKIGSYIQSDVSQGEDLDSVATIMLYSVRIT